MQDVALVRIEQLAPLHYAGIVKVIKRYPNVKQVVWFQEEHKNSGAWSYVYPRISSVLEWLKKEGKINNSELKCVSRKTSASPAIGKKTKHNAQQVEILNALYAD